MSASEKAKLHIRSAVKNDGGDEESISYTVVGEYLKTNEGFSISYNEITESGKANCQMLVSADTVTVERRGAIASRIVFQEGREHSSIYSMGGFSFDMTVKTKKTKIELTENGGRLALQYEMTVGGADKAVHFSVRVEKA